jgi:hypothetical protein
MPVHVCHGRHAYAWWLVDVDGLDADAWTDLARRRDLIPQHVGCDDDSDDAPFFGSNAVALPVRPSAEQAKHGWAG